jgi:phage I-like protein
MSNITAYLTKFAETIKSVCMDTDRTSCAFQSDINEPTGSIVYLPEGEHMISATVGGKPKQVNVKVDRSVLAAFADDLKARQEANVRPFAGFDHQSGPASFLPVEFRYEEGVGLVLDVEWTKAGREAIEGRDYSYFSPTFMLSPQGVPYGLAKRGEIGSLVNDPAFESIQRIAAQHTEPQNNDMEQLIELGLVEASCAPEQALEIAKASLANLRESAAQAEQLETVQAAAKTAEEKLVEKEEQLAKLQAAYDELKKKMSDTAQASAQAAVDEAVKAGRIAPQDEDSKSFWLDALVSNPSSAKVLASLPANPVVDGSTVLAGRTEESNPQSELTGLDRVLAAFKNQSNQ